MICAGIVHATKNDDAAKKAALLIKKPQPTKVSDTHDKAAKKVARNDRFSKESKPQLPRMACNNFICGVVGKRFRAQVPSKADLAKKHIIQHQSKYTLDTMYKETSYPTGRVYEFRGPNGKNVSIMVGKNSQGRQTYYYSLTGARGSWKQFRYAEKLTPSSRGERASRNGITKLDDALSSIFRNRSKKIARVKKAFFAAAISKNKNLSGGGTISGDMWVKKGSFGFSPSYEHFNVNYTIKTDSRTGRRMVSLELEARAGTSPTIEFTLDQSTFYRLAGIKTSGTKTNVAVRKR